MEGEIVAIFRASFGSTAAAVAAADGFDSAILPSPPSTLLRPPAAASPASASLHILMKGL